MTKINFEIKLPIIQSENSGPVGIDLVSSLTVCCLDLRD